MTPLSRLPAVEGWEDVVAPAPAAKPDAECLVWLIKRGKTNRLWLCLSISQALHEHLGQVETALIRYNHAERALMIQPAGPVQWQRFAKGVRRSCRLAPFKAMAAETARLPATCALIEWRGKPAIVISLPHGLYSGHQR